MTQALLSHRYPSGVWINGVDLREFGVIGIGSTGLLDRPESVYQSRPLAGKPGAALLDEKPATPARTITLSMQLAAPSAADLVGRVDAVKSWLVGKLGYVEIRTSVADDRYLTGHLTTCRVQLPAGKQLKAETATIDASFLCVDPFYRSSVLTTIPVIGSAPVDAPVGTAPSLPTISIAGPFTDPVVRLYTRGSAGSASEIASFAFDAVGSAGDSIVIDAEQMVTTRTLAGNVTVSGDLAYPVIGDELRGIAAPVGGALPVVHAPRIAVTGLGVGGSASATYAKRWR